MQNIGNVGQWTCRKKVNKENYNKAVMSQNLLNCMNCFELGLSDYSEKFYG